VASVLEKKAKDNRYAFVTGSEDFNKPGTVMAFEYYKNLKFPYAIYLEEPGLPHRMPSASYFAKALDFVDAPIIALAEKQRDAGLAFEEMQRWLDAYIAYQAAASCAIAAHVYQEVQPAMVRIRPAVEAEAQEEFANVMKKSNGASLRAFIEKWPTEYNIVAQARVEAEKMASEEYDKQIAGKPRVTSIRAFLNTWDGYTICKRAIVALDELARQEWGSVNATKPGASRWKALATFAETWKPTTTGALAERRMMDEITEKIKEAEALPSDGAKAQRLKLLYIETKNTPANQAVQSALVEVALRLQQ
jgi:hypothetical protein